MFFGSCDAFASESFNMAAKILWISIFLFFNAYVEAQECDVYGRPMQPYVYPPSPAELTRCADGEEFRTDSIPEASCGELYPDAVGIRSGCFCPKDSVRDATGNCIKVYMCPQYAIPIPIGPEVAPVQSTVAPAITTYSCPANEVYKVDLYPEPCCDLLFPEYGNLKEGCFCPKDYVRNAAGQCIQVKDCPQFATPAIVSEPTTAAPEPITTGPIIMFEPYPKPTTDAPATEAPTTVAPATEAPATEAPATEAPATEAPATEAPATEAPATEVPATGDYSLRSCLPTFKCIPGTTFKLGYNICVCNENGEAICSTGSDIESPTTAAPPTCPAGEVWTNGLSPEPTCDNIFPENVIVKEGCYCPDNFVRNAEGKCIDVKTCPQFAPTEAPAAPTCGAGEVYMTDFYPEASCDNLYPEYINIKDGCFCASGTVRNSAGQCVSIYNCPQYTTSMSEVTPATEKPTEKPAEQPSEKPKRRKCFPGMVTKTRKHEICVCNRDGRSETCYPTAVEIPDDGKCSDDSKKNSSECEN
ncbi:uncharacterized protein LOC143914893 isoform X1 [Arctopsyche grandis]|uniref:uncharacterized protein LOC143914893 isoform X1 n=1 Tax=Arctopsyche grandis TaxID=121162 RepID=UPI00406D995A